METLPFRPPQFSDDVAWLPAWLQPNQSAATSEDVANENVDPLEGENCQVKEPNLSENIEGRYNICHLYFSENESIPVTLTPSCGKEVFHFNLRLSTDETLSIISNPFLHTSQDDKRKFTPALPDTTGKSLCYMDHDSTKMSIVPSSREKFSGCFGDQTPLTNAAGKYTLELLNLSCAEYDDISDAVELSVAASEALVIHDVVQSAADALPTPAILEVALRVKQARLDGKKDSSCCFNDFRETVDILSDLGDSDMEDAYKDVGLSFSSLDNIYLQDPSPSRVQETPVSEIPGEDKEVKCKFQGVQEVYLNNSFATEPRENILETNESKDFPVELLNDWKLEKLRGKPPVDLIDGNQLQNGSLDDLQTLQEGKNDMSSVEGLPHQLEVYPLPRSLYSIKARQASTSTKWHSNYVDMNAVSNSPSCRFKSRWFGGWTGMEGDVSGEMKSKGRCRKVIPKFFVGETSYLSESMDVFPDQYSVVHNYHHTSSASESIKSFEDLSKAATEGAFVSEEVVKSSNSFIDPLCSMVPCSISAEIGDSMMPNCNNDVHKVLDAFKSLHTGTVTPTGISQASSRDKDENVVREAHDGLDCSDVPLIIRRKVTSLKAYSTGLRMSSAFSSKRNYKCGFLSLGENDPRVLSNSTNSLNDKDTTKLQPFTSTSNCGTAKSNQKDQEMMLLSVKQCISCTNTSEMKDFEKQAPIKSVFSCTIATNVEDACEKLVQDHYETNAESSGGLHVHLEDIPASPLVLCQRTRRLKAPKLYVNDVSTTNVLEDQAPVSDNICHEIREFPQDQFRDLPKSDIPARKRVRFSDVDFKLQMPRCQLEKNLRRENWSSCRLGDKSENYNQEQGTASQELKERLTKCRIKGKKRTIFQGMDFLLTGFSKKKEKEMEGLLRKHGGMVLSDIPASLPHPRRRRSSRFNPERLPVVLCTKKLQTTRFLYGCAVNAFLLKVSWAYDSIRAGSVLPPDKYLILSNQSNWMLNQIGKTVCQNDNDYIFDKVGVMLHGTHKFCTKLAEVIKHGRGCVYKSLQWLVQSLEKKKISLGAIVVEDENRATRHLKKCASEQKIAVAPARWIINSLFDGKLHPLKENYHLSNQQPIKVQDVSALQEWSQEI